MGLWLGLMLLLAGCAMSEPAVQLGDAISFDGPEEGTARPETQDIAEMDSQPDDGPFETGDLTDVPLTCESVLEEWQCISDSTCQSWMQCIGVGGCEEKPCWGLCDDYPGACLAALRPKACIYAANCDKAEVCVGVWEDATGKEVPGLCRKRPSTDTCYEDKDCGDKRKCVGATRCVASSFCLGPEFPGKCVEEAGPGGCWEDADCKAGERCEGVLWCAPGASGCKDKAGVCKADAGCFSDEDCGAGRFCVGALRCQDPSACVLPEKPGWCFGPPGLRQCWEDKHCGGEWVCRSALPCPPGSFCAGIGAQHPGICGEPPEGGVIVRLGTSTPKTDEGLPVIIVNNSATLIFFDPCKIGFIQFLDDNGQWVDSWLEPLAHPACSQNGPLLPLAPAQGFVAIFQTNVPGQYRVQVLYAIGCEQGVLASKAKCKGTPQIKVLNSEAFEVSWQSD